MTQILTPKLEIVFHSDFVLLIIQTMIATSIVLITAEFLPKAIFRIFPNQILNYLSVPICLVFFVLRPVTI